MLRVTPMHSITNTVSVKLPIVAEITNSTFSTSTFSSQKTQSTLFHPKVLPKLPNMHHNASTYMVSACKDLGRNSGVAYSPSAKFTLRAHRKNVHARVFINRRESERAGTYVCMGPRLRCLDFPSCHMHRS